MFACSRPRFYAVLLPVFETNTPNACIASQMYKVANIIVLTNERLIGEWRVWKGHDLHTDTESCE